MNDSKLSFQMINKWYLLLFHLNGLLSSVLGQSCGPRVSPRLLKDNIPCDLSAVSYCTQPGSAYPWSSVRRYIFENQGFVKKMYGEQRQSQILREELRRINIQYEFDIPELTLKNARQPKSDKKTNEDKIDENGATSTPMDNNFDDGTTDVGTSTNQQWFDTSTEFNRPTIQSINEFLTDDVIDETNNNNDMNNDNNDTESQQQSVKGYNACPITQEVVAPYWANNTRGETLALLNVYPFEQYIHWEKCAFEGEQMFCRDGCRCEQQFRLHRLLAFDPKNECRGIFADWFRFPGCCVCICYDNHERINNRKARL